MIGTTLGSYRIVRELGMGGMGVVYYAEHPMLGKRVAIKLLRTELSRNQEVVGRFFNEAKAVTTINHPGLVDIYDFGYTNDGSAYIVMEFLEGESLAARLRRERPTVDVVIALARQLAGALGAAHARGIVHRDLKPDNIYLTPDPDVALGIRAQVLDFGIAKLAPGLGGLESSPNAPETRTGMMMGTPSYMAPEQCRGAKDVDARADIYAFGVILFEMLTGDVPFHGEGIGEVIAKHQYEAPPKPSSLAPSLPSHLEALVLRMLEKKPEHRPQSVEEVAAALDPASAGRVSAIGAAQSGSGLSVEPVKTTTLGSVAAEATASPSNRRGVFLGVGMVVAVGVVVAVLMARGGSSSEPSGPANPPAAGSTTAVATDPPPAAPPPTPAPIKETPPPPPPPPPSQVTLKIESVPSGAEVFRAVDGVRVGKTPHTQRVDRVDGQAVYVVKQSGYKDEHVELDSSTDQSRTVRLTRLQVTRPVEQPGTGLQAVDPFGSKKGTKR